MKIIKKLIVPANQTASVCSNIPEENSNKGLIVSLDCGCDCRRNECRTLLQFPQDVLPNGAKLLKATLCLNPLKGNLRSIYVLRNLTGFEQGSVTWQTRPKTENKPFARACVDTGGIEIDVISAFKQCGGYFGLTLVADTLGNLLINGKDNAPYLKLNYFAKDHPAPPGKNKVENIFDEDIFIFEEGSDPVRYSSTFDASTSERVTFFIKNTGSDPFVFNIQISPDGADFIDDAQIFEVAPAELKAFTPYLFARYMRAKIVPSVFGTATSAVLRIQAQTRNYLIK